MKLVLIFEVARITANVTSNSLESKNFGSCMCTRLIVHTALLSFAN